ncbi:MAG TPA: metal-dependent hydrolase [Gemmataceae bacterium]|nr:metal-dependent hydrolase [Gemmataceae bacterium]
MASYRGHLAFAGLLGAGYGSLAFLEWGWDWGPALMAAGLTTLGGLLPDLDSDSGVPVRELFGVSAAIAPILLFDRVKSRCQGSTEQTLIVLAAIYLFIRYLLSYLFKHFTVHRGMFHSVPALLIAGLATYLLYPSGNPRMRLFLSGAVMLGFLSHLILDEIYSVDFMGARLHLNKYAGSALKFFSKSWPATLATYLLLAFLVWRFWLAG